MIVGRNANTILKNFEDSLHVFVYADPYWRMEHMKAKMPDMTEAKISEEMHTIDRSQKEILLLLYQYGIWCGGLL